MPKNKQIRELTEQFEQLRRDSVAKAEKANRIVTKAVRKIADKELKALEEYYEAVTVSIRSARKGDSVKDLAQHQLDLMQATVAKLIDGARDSLQVIAQAREELTRLLQESAATAGPSSVDLAKVIEPARKAIREVRRAAAAAIAPSEPDKPAHKPAAPAKAARTKIASKKMAPRKPATRKAAVADDAPPTH